jgi:long-chain fatty acid transport protein
LSAARFGGEHGTPVSANPTAIYYNPAGLTGAAGTHVLFDATVFLRRTTYVHTPHPTDVPEPAGLEGANTDRATLVNVNFIPMLGASHKIGGFAFGGAFYVPFGGGTMWQENERFAGNVDFPGAVGGAQRWHALDGELQLYYWTLAVAYEIPDTGLSLGASGSLIHSAILSNQARTAMGDNNMNNEGRSLVDMAAWAGGFGVGAMFEALEDMLWFGASYTSRPNVAGGHRLSGTLKNNFGTINEFEGELHQDIPDIIRLGVRFRPTPKAELRLHGDWTRWSAFESQCVSLKDEPCEVDEDGRALSDPEPLQNMPRNWHDAVGVRLSASYWITHRWEYIAGLGYDGNAIPDETLEPSLTDFHDFYAAVGAGYELIEQHLNVQLIYTHFFNIPRDTSGESELALAADSFSRVPDSGGHYAEVAGLVNLTVEAAF